MNIISTFISNAIFTIFHPSFWIMNCPSNEWNSTLLKLMENNKFEKFNGYAFLIVDLEGLISISGGLGVKLP